MTNTMHTSEPTGQSEKQKGSPFVEVADLRDYFAAKVMASWIVASQEFNGEEESHRDHLSSIAYAQADSMLAERAK